MSMEEKSSRLKSTMGYLRKESGETVQKHNFMVLTEEETENLKIPEHQIFLVMKYCLALLEQGGLSERDKENVKKMYDIATGNKILVKMLTVKKNLQ